MATRTTPWPNGTPSWADVPIPDRAVGNAFYEAVLGWRFEAPNEQLGGYANAYLDDRHVVGSMALSPGQPVAWTLYFAVDDAHKTAAAITEAGGTVLAEPMDVVGLGTMVMASDPTGAMFGLWQAGTHLGTKVYGEPGAIAWEDLRSTDPAAAQAFYTRVLGVEFEPMEMAGPDYGTFGLPGEPAPLGGIGGMMGSQGPSHWVVYFAVADVDAALEAATTHGGTVLSPAFDSPYGRMASVADPAGAEFTIITPSMESPDRP